ncbi:MAG TPA: ATP synthase F1 subunit delta, partial [Chitinophagales bacterium]|nr:ATP synthase F1 subunit delta [Chitinophagales bacterium]
MSAYSLSTRYAKSLIGLAQEKGRLEQVYNDVKAIDGILSASPDLKAMYKSPIITIDKKLNVSRLLFEGKTDDIIYRFMVLVIKKGREAYLNEIFEAFITQYNLIKGITRVKITSAVKLDAGLVKSITDSLKARENMPSVELQEVIDKDMIGGFVLQYDDKMLDNSVSRRLSEWKDAIEDDSF